MKRKKKLSYEIDWITRRCKSHTSNDRRLTSKNINNIESRASRFKKKKTNNQKKKATQWAKIYRVRKTVKMTTKKQYSAIVNSQEIPLVSVHERVLNPSDRRWCKVHKTIQWEYVRFVRSVCKCFRNYLRYNVFNFGFKLRHFWPEDRLTIHIKNEYELIKTYPYTKNQ